LQHSAEQLLGEVIERLRQAAARAPDDIFVLHLLGDALLKSKNYPEAEKVYGNGIDLDGNNAMLLRGHGDALAGLGCYHEALEDYEKALASVIDMVGNSRRDVAVDDEIVRLHHRIGEMTLSINMLGAQRL
jgi:tetratricopeptide (TPR) repeat protein